MRNYLAVQLTRASHALTKRHTHGWRWAYASVLGLGMYAAMPTPTPVLAPQPAPAVVSPWSDPKQLSDADITRYRMIDTAQEAGDFATADTLMQQLENPGLIGHVLATRYTNPNYHASTAELDAWLARYSDHPGAARIAKLAASRGTSFARAKMERNKPLSGDGYVDHLGRTSMPDNWYEGLRHWKEQHYARALPIFAAVAADESLSDWQRAAGYYWAYRSADKLGQSRAANSALAAASEYQTTFYGLLAATQRGTVRLTARAPEVSDRLRDAPHAVRAALLAQLDKRDAAESELRLLYANVPASERTGIITLASEMNLPNLQVRLGRLPELSTAEAIFARYPMPRFMTEAQLPVDPALLMAIARNESGFRADVGSAAGAVGMMQMLPSTARGLERRMGAELASSSGTESIVGRLSNPATAMLYGAEYIKLLSAESAISGNLVRLLAGYNAGPGAVASWASAARTMNDPLLYIESIPYAETRNYVMQVMAQYWVYQTLRGDTTTSLAAMTKGHWPQV